MHVTLVTPAFLHPERADFPGIRRYSTELARALDRAGVGVRVVTPEEDGGAEDSVGDIDIVRLKADRYLAGRAGNVAQARVLSFARRLVRSPELVRHTDILHSDVPLLGIDAVRRWCPVVATGHHIERIRGPPDLLNVPFGNSYGSYTFRRADAVVVPSEATAARMARRFHVGPRRIRVIHHGIDVSRFHPEAPTEKSLRNPGTRTILFVGPMSRRKNVLLLLQAFVGLTHARPDSRLVLVGSGSLDAQIERMIGRHSLERNVLRLRRLDETELCRAYWSADLFASPSLDEGFGFSVVEAMACRVPVVVLDTPVNREIVGDAGLLVPEASPGAWTDALRSVVEGPRLAEELGERGRRRVEERYSWKVAADRYVQVYEELLRERAAH